jgi:subtilisin family serine protease
VIDTGVDLNHREFTNTKFDPLSYNVNERLVGIQHLMDDGGHGTQVIGVIAANNRDNEGVSGTAPNVTIMVIKANKVPANIYSPIRVAIGIRYAADNGAHIINLSMAAITTDENIASAIEYAASKDVIVVAAAGNNSSGTPYYPGAFANVIAVSSIDDQQNISGFSNYGPNIDIAAPGSSITTTRYSSQNADLDPYSRTSGTSFAAPQVAAALALVKSANPELTGQQVIDKILSTARDAGSPGFDNYYGHGILDIKAALNIQDPVQPSSSISSETTTSSEQTSSQQEEPTIWTVTFKMNNFVYRIEVVENLQTLKVPLDPPIKLFKPRIRSVPIAFSGWFTESGQLFDFSSPITSDTVLVARFKIIKIIK